MKENPGFLGLCLILSAKSRDLELLTETLQAIGLRFTADEGKRAYRSALIDLDKPERDWLKGNMRKLYVSSGQNAPYRTPYSAYLWERRETELINVMVGVKLTEKEASAIAQLATQEGVTKSAFIRRVLQQAIAQIQQPGENAGATCKRQSKACPQRSSSTGKTRTV